MPHRNSLMKKNRRTVLALACATFALSLAGCAVPRAQSSVEIPGQFASTAEPQAEPEVAWWDSFGDPVLSRLVRRAAYENRDVKMALERVRAARAGETVSRSALLPTVGVSALSQYSDTGRGAAFKA